MKKYLYKISLQNIFTKYLYKISLQNIFTKYLYKISLQNIFILVAFLLLSCANDATSSTGTGGNTQPPPPPQNPPTGTITLTRNQITLPQNYLNVTTGTNTYSGPAFTLNGLISYEPTNATLTYQSSNATLVQVSEEGLLTVQANPATATNVVISLALTGFTNSEAQTNLTVNFVSSRDNHIVYLSEGYNRTSNSCQVTLNILASPSISTAIGQFTSINFDDNSLSTDLASIGVTPSNNRLIANPRDINSNSSLTNNNVLFSVANHPMFASDTLPVGVTPRIQHMSVEILNNNSGNNFYYLTGNLLSTGSGVNSLTAGTTHAYNYLCERQAVTGS